MNKILRYFELWTNASKSYSFSLSPSWANLLHRFAAQEASHSCDRGIVDLAAAERTLFHLASGNLRFLQTYRAFCTWWWQAPQEANSKPRDMKLHFVWSHFLCAKRKARKMGPENERTCFSHAKPLELNLSCSCSSSRLTIHYYAIASNYPIEHFIVLENVKSFIVLYSWSLVSANALRPTGILVALILSFQQASGFFACKGT